MDSMDNMDIAEILSPLPCMYEALVNEKRPVLLYGMGDGAEKIFAALTKRGIAVSGVFASEGFVRGQRFLGFPVMSLAEAEDRHGDFVAVLCFALEGEKAGILRFIKEKHTLFSPNLPVYGKGIYNKESIFSDIDRIKRLHGCLADEASKALLLSLLKYNITGNIDYLFESEERFSPPPGFFIHLKRHIDVGAYDGDTVLEYAEYNKSYSDIVAFEPDRRNYGRLIKNTSHIAKIICENVAVSDYTGESGFLGKGGRAAALSAVAGKEVKTVSIDNYCGQQTISGGTIPVGSIKIDAEGEDKKVLQGAVNTLYVHNPDIMVALYHRAGDIVDIPLLVRNYDYKYKLYLRKKAYVPAWDVFLLAKR